MIMLVLFRDMLSQGKGAIIPHDCAVPSPEHDVLREEQSHS